MHKVGCYWIATDEEIRALVKGVSRLVETLGTKEEPVVLDPTAAMAVSPVSETA